MAIGVPNGGTNTAFAGAATSAVPFPTTTHAGATLLLGISLNTGAAGCTTPAGWSLEATLGSTATTLLPTVFVFRKIADGTEGGTNLTVTHASVANRAQIVELAGVDANSPIDVTTGTVDSSAGGQANCVLPSQTTVTPGVTRIAFSASSAATQTATPPAGWTELSDSSGVTATLEVAYIQGVAAGATGTATVVFSGVGKQVGIVVALRPEIVAPTQQTPRRRFTLPFLRRSGSRSVQSVPSALPPPPPVARGRHAAPPVQRRARSAQPVRTNVAVATTQALPPQTLRARLIPIPRRRGRHAAPVNAPAGVLPPQPDTPHPTSPRRRRATFAQPLPVVTPSAVPLLGDTRRAVIPPPLVRRSRSRVVVPATTPVVTTQALPPQPSLRRRALTPLRRVRAVFVPAPPLAPPPFVARARHAAPPLPRRRRLLLPPARAVQPPPLVMRARHAAPPMRRRVLAAFTPFPVLPPNSWVRTVTDLLGLTDFMSVTYTTDGTHSTPTGTTTPPPHTLNPLFEPGQWLYGNATPNRNRRPPLASRKDPPQQ